MWMCEEGEGGEAEGPAEWGTAAETAHVGATAANAAAAARVCLGISSTAAAEWVEWTRSADDAAGVLW